MTEDDSNDEKSGTEVGNCVKEQVSSKTVNSNREYKRKNTDERIYTAQPHTARRYGCVCVCAVTSLVIGH